MDFAFDMKEKGLTYSKSSPSLANCNQDTAKWYPE